MTEPSMLVQTGVNFKLIGECNTILSAYTTYCTQPTCSISNTIKQTCSIVSFVLTGAFWCCWFPYAVATFWAAFGNPDTVPLVVTAIPAAAAKTQVVWNPLLYVITNKQFRRSFYEILPCTGLREMLLKQEEKGQGSKASALDLDSNQENEAQDKVSVYFTF